MTKVLFSILLALAVTSPAFSMGKRPEKNRLSFHIQTDRTDGQKMVFPVPFGNKKLFFSKTPIVTIKNIVSLKHFVAEDGSFGAAFSFDKIGANRVAAVTTANQDKWLVAMLNGRPVDVVFVDRPIVDGKLVVWKDIKQKEIIRFEYAMPITGETREQWKARIKGHEKQRKAAKKAAKEEQDERNQRRSQ